jgi:spore coat protein U-like protein
MSAGALRGMAWVLAFGLAQLGAVAHATMSCTIERVTGVSFGSYDSGRSSPVDSAGLVAFRCTHVAPGDMITIELGRGDSNSFQPRAMTMRSEKLEYNLFLDAARTIIWGDGTSGTSTYVARPADGQSTQVPIFGRIPPRQSVRGGTYNDVIILTVLY